MSRIKKFKLTLIITGCLFPVFLIGQTNIEYLGLSDYNITSMDIYGPHIVVGTDGDGVFTQNTGALPDSAWNLMGLDGKNVTAVYPHKSGPLMWGVTAGVTPEEDDSTYIYCNLAGDEFYPNSDGIADSMVTKIYSLAGFPDPTICGEKYAAVGRVIYRQQYGDTVWVPVFESLGVEGEGVVFVKTRGSIVLAGGSEGFTGILLVKSLNFGDTWEYLYPPGPVVSLDFDVNSTYSDIDTVFVNHGGQISRSVDGGANWEVVYSGGGWNYFNCILYDSENSRVFVAGGDGLDTSSAVLFYSNDLGLSWSPIALNFSGPVVAMELGPENQLYIAAPYSGVFRISVEELSVGSELIPRSFILHQNYPNPFNGLTTIQYELHRRSLVNITVHNILGNEITRLIDGIRPSGVHTVNWDAAQLASGIYFYRLSLEGDTVEESKTFTRKMLLIK